MPQLTEQQKAAMAGAERVDISVSYERPGVVTFVGIVIFIQAAIAAVSAVVLFLNAEESDYQSVLGQTENELITAAVVEAVLAVLLFLVAWGVMTGWAWSRIAVAIVFGLRLAASAWFLLTHLGGGINTNALIQAGIAIFVLWALYGNDRSDLFFRGREGTLTA